MYKNYFIKNKNITSKKLSENLQKVLFKTILSYYHAYKYNGTILHKIENFVINHRNTKLHRDTTIW